MIETLTTAVIVLAISLVGLTSITYGVFLSDQNKRIARIKKEFIDDTFKMQEDIEAIERKQRDLDLNGIDYKIDKINKEIELLEDKSKISDGSHTFEELYHHRAILFSIICNTYKNQSWKSWKHDDGTMFEDYFVVGVTTEQGEYSYHYHKDYWKYFEVKELTYAPVWDGHKPSDIERLFTLLKE